MVLSWCDSNLSFIKCLTNSNCFLIIRLPNGQLIKDINQLTLLVTTSGEHPVPEGMIGHFLQNDA